MEVDKVNSSGSKNLINQILQQAYADGQPTDKDVRWVETLLGALGDGALHGKKGAKVFDKLTDKAFEDGSLGVQDSKLIELIAGKIGPEAAKGVARKVVNDLVEHVYQDNNLSNVELSLLQHVARQVGQKTPDGVSDRVTTHDPEPAVIPPSETPGWVPPDRVGVPDIARVQGYPSIDARTSAVIREFLQLAGADGLSDRELAALVGIIGSSLSSPMRPMPLPVLVDEPVFMQEGGGPRGGGGSGHGGSETGGASGHGGSESSGHASSTDGGGAAPTDAPQEMIYRYPDQVESHDPGPAGTVPDAAYIAPPPMDAIALIGMFLSQAGRDGNLSDKELDALMSLLATLRAGRPQGATEPGIGQSMWDGMEWMSAPGLKRATEPRDAPAVDYPAAGLGGLTHYFINQAARFGIYGEDIAGKAHLAADGVPFDQRGPQV